jgi:hypothetical protein
VINAQKRVILAACDSEIFHALLIPDSKLRAKRGRRKHELQKLTKPKTIKMMATFNFSDNGMSKEPKMRILPDGFSPAEHDVVCGRGRKVFMLVGNQRFRQLVESRLQDYSSAANKLEKSCIICEIVTYLRNRSPHGAFVKMSSKDGRWYQLGDFLSREKTSQAFRDALVDRHSSINESKKELLNRKPHRAAVSEGTVQATLQVQPIPHPITNNGVKAHSAGNHFGGKSVDAQNPTSKHNRATEQAFMDEGSIFERLVLLVDTLDKGDDPFEPVPCFVASFAA